MFTILRSSAGAGKTHALVKHYLALVLRGESPDAYRRVLALTFTNKAAAEMKQRVMDYLRELGHEGDKKNAIADVHQHLLAEFDIAPEALQQRANAVLSHMLHHYGDVAISTIDAFTRRVVRPFARDLGLEHDLRMTTEQDLYRSKAVDLLLSEAGTEAELTDLLVTVCEQLLDDERGWRPDEPLNALSKELDNERSIRPLEHLRGIPLERFTALHSKIGTQLQAVRDRLRRLGREGMRAIEEAGLTADHFFQKGTGPYGYIKRLTTFTHELKPANSYVRRALEDDKWTSGSATPATAARVQEVAPLLRRIINEAEAMRENDLPTFHVMRAVRDDLLPTAALHLLDLKLRQLKSDESVAFFSDLTRQVARIVQEEPAPFLYERIGERYTHFLIDEFQDTSLLQWWSLLPLVENALANGGTVLLVGDAKQAIYRWRNGEVRQFKELPMIFGKEHLLLGMQRERTLQGYNVDVEPLADNRRSGSAIIELNNNLFASLRELLPEDLRSVYEAHEQKSFKAQSGYVRLEALPKRKRTEHEEEETEERIELQRLLAWIRECEASGFVPGDIAVLVRTKEQASQIAEFLRPNRVEVVSPNALRLGGDAYVELLIDLLRYLRTAADDAAARVAQRLPSLLTEGPNGIPDPVRSVRAWLVQHSRVSARLPVVELLNALADAAMLDPATDPYLLFLLDEAHAFGLRDSGGLGAFLEHWDRIGSLRGVERPPSRDAVRIMTIHASKGLQFPVVMVPFSSMRSNQQGRDRLWIDPHESAPDLPNALVRRNAELNDLGIPEIEEEEDLRALDELDQLYVAFTRPEQRLYALVLEPGETSTDRFSKGLFAFVAEQGADHVLVDGTPAAAEPRKEAVPVTELRPVQGGNWRTHLKIREEAPEDWDPAEPDPWRAYGEQVHAIMAQLRTADDLQQVIDSEVRAGAIEADEAQALFAKLEALLRRPDLHPFFNAFAEVRTEAALITADGRQLRPDRIVSNGDGTRVLDIKTGMPRDSHHEQVSGYVALLRELGAAQVSGHLLYLRDGALIDVA